MTAALVSYKVPDPPAPDQILTVNVSEPSVSASAEGVTLNDPVPAPDILNDDVLVEKSSGLLTVQYIVPAGILVEETVKFTLLPSLTFVAPRVTEALAAPPPPLPVPNPGAVPAVWVSVRITESAVAVTPDGTGLTIASNDL